MDSELLATFYVVKILNGEFCKNWGDGIAALGFLRLFAAMSLWSILRPPL
jgi:hypothetical protein